jgi:hypothetical protein
MIGSVPPFPLMPSWCVQIQFTFLGAFTYEKRLLASSYQSDGMEQVVTHWTDFHKLSSSKPTCNARRVPITLH